MPKKSQSSPIVGKLDQAVLDHRNDETEYNVGGEIPAGIEGGIAELVSCKVGTYATGAMRGKDYWRADAVIKLPKKFNGSYIEGMRTSIMEPLCDTPTRSRPTVGDHVKYVLNHLRALGGETEELESWEESKVLMGVLADSGIHLRFRTWAGGKQEIEERGGKFYVSQSGKEIGGPYANEQQLKAVYPYVGTVPRTVHEWSGSVDYVADEETNGLVDNTGSEEEIEPVDRIIEKKKEEVGGDEIPFEEEEPDNLDSLAKLASMEKPEATSKLEEIAEGLKIPKLQVETAPDWESVVEMIREKQSQEIKEELEPEEDFGDWKPDIEELYNYKPPGKRKLVQCEVIDVNYTQQLCSLQSVEDQTEYPDIAWGKLVDVE